MDDSILPKYMKDLHNIHVYIAIVAQYITVLFLDYCIMIVKIILCFMH